jgi:hypothetical protein
MADDPRTKEDPAREQQMKKYHEEDLKRRKEAREAEAQESQQTADDKPEP